MRPSWWDNKAQLHWVVQAREDHAGLHGRPSQQFCKRWLGGGHRGCRSQGRGQGELACVSCPLRARWFHFHYPEVGPAPEG